MYSEPNVDISVAEKLGRSKETKLFPLGVWAHVCVLLMDDHCFVNLLWKDLNCLALLILKFQSTACCLLVFGYGSIKGNSSIQLIGGSNDQEKCSFIIFTEFIKLIC